MGAIAAAAGTRAELTEAGFWASYARNIPTTDETRDTGAVPVAGGYAICVQGTRLDYAMGVGRTRPLRPADLAALDEFYGSRKLPAQVELHEAVAERDADLLAAWGYVPVTRLAVLEREIGHAPLPDPPIAVEPMTGRRAEWIDLVVAASADSTPPAQVEQLRRSFALSATAGLLQFGARIDGRLVGGASLGMSGDIAFLMAAATLPAFRGRGVQTALIAARLQAAQTRGATYAFMKTEIDSPAMRSAERAGFTRIYDRVRMRKV
ncbi:MAG: GNAT family N-acetyltransferase [Candidatus Velthaea sp.]